VYSGDKQHPIIPPWRAVHWRTRLTSKFHCFSVPLGKKGNCVWVGAVRGQTGGLLAASWRPPLQPAGNFGVYGMIDQMLWRKAGICDMDWTTLRNLISLRMRDPELGIGGMRPARNHCQGPQWSKDAISCLRAAPSQPHHSRGCGTQALAPVAPASAARSA
jgi:hypothetical protein